MNNFNEEYCEFPLESRGSDIVYTFTPPDYTKMTIDDLFLSITGGGYGIGDFASSWVMAENIMEQRKLLIEWFNKIENGTADNNYPDPFFSKPISQELADKIIEELDDDFDKESNRWVQYGVEAGPGYFRLAPHARIALVQELSKIKKSDEAIKKEADERIAKGENIPPKNALNQMIPNYTDY